MRLFGVAAAVLTLFGAAVMAEAVEAFVYGGRTMVPLRTVGESFGAAVQYNSRTKGVSISLDYQKVDMTVNSPRARVGDRVVVLDTAAVVADGVCYVPARFVSETFGFGINWGSAERRVIIVHPKTKKQIVLGVSHHVPPGLAKKGGMPPGQAKKYGHSGHGAAKNKAKGHGK
jgi:hypothetical protein